MRATELEQRENAVKQRERELAEQRRILAEEYRLLRSRMAAGVQAPVPPGRAAAHAPMHMSAVRPESLWMRVKRVVLGTSAPATD